MPIGHSKWQRPHAVFGNQSFGVQINHELIELKMAKGRANQNVKSCHSQTVLLPASCIQLTMLTRDDYIMEFLHNYWVVWLVVDHPVNRKSFKSTRQLILIIFWLAEKF